MKSMNESLPLEVNRLVIALCGDYDRRQHILERKCASPDTLAHFYQLNSAIDNAVAEVCEEAICRQMREDIGAGRGARRSPLYFLSEGAYKQRKRAAKYRIARSLNLL